MKKAFAVSFLLIIVMLIASCGGVRDQRYIRLTDPISGDTIQIRVDSKRVAYKQWFSTDMDIYGLAGEIEKKNTQLVARVYQGNMIMITTKTNIFYIYQDEEYDEHIGSSFRYMVGSTEGLFVYSPVETTDIADSSVTRVPMYLPYHILRGLPGHSYPFFSISSVPVNGNDEAYDFTLRNTIECEALGDIADFIAFYNNIDHCDIELSGDTLTVTNKVNGYALDITFSQEAEFVIVTFSVLANFVEPVFDS